MFKSWHLNMIYDHFQGSRITVLSKIIKNVSIYLCVIVHV